MFYFKAKVFYGGSGPVTLLFKKQADRDAFVLSHDQCRKDGKIKEEHIWDNGGNHIGIFVEKSGDKYIDAESGVDLD